MTDSKKKNLTPEELKKASGGASVSGHPNLGQASHGGARSSTGDLSKDELKRAQGGMSAATPQVDRDRDRDADANRTRNRDQAGGPSLSR